jgi:hypothetical protein
MTAMAVGVVMTAMSGRRADLPVPLTRLAGRERELPEVVWLVPARGLVALARALGGQGPGQDPRQSAVAGQPCGYTFEAAGTSAGRRARKAGGIT